MIISILLLVAAGSAGAAPEVRQAPTISPDKVLTLAEAIDLAIRNQPAVRQAAAQVEARKGALTQARSRLLPDTSISGSSQVAGSSGDSRTALSAVGSQLLYDFGRSKWGLTEAERLLAAGTQGYRATAADVILGVKLAYYELLRTTNLVRVFEENLKTSEGHVDMARERLSAGVAPRADLLKAQARAASARVDLVAARNAAGLARVGLNSAIGVDVRSSTQIAEASEPESAVPDADQVVELAIKNRPEVREASESVKAAQAAVSSTRTGNLPALRTSLGGSRIFTGETFGEADAWQWMLNLNWSPFDSGLTRGAVAQARAQLAGAEESLYSARQAVSSDAVAARLNLLAAIETLEAAKVEVESAREDMESASGRYQAGVGIFLEVTDAQASLVKAQVDELSARYGISKSRAGLDHALGLTEWKGTQYE